jgi:aconitate hydratase
MSNNYITPKISMSSVSKKLGRPATYTEKILYTHLSEDDSTKIYEPTKDYVDFYPDRVAMQDATAQMALLQFLAGAKKNKNLTKVRIPTTVHCDHLILALDGATEDLKNSIERNEEVYNFLSTACKKLGIGFWEPGSGIIHQVVLEKYALPGQMMIGTDSHTPNAGGLGMIAIGVGGGDAVDVMAGLPFNTAMPKLIGVKLTGVLSGWAAPKDIILELAGELTVNGGTGAIVEYFGDGCETISTTGKATMCNMGAEIGATCSLFPYDQTMYDYLCSVGRKEDADIVESFKDDLKADLGSEKYYDRIVEIDLSSLVPNVVGPHTPDLLRTTSELAKVAEAEKYPLRVSAALIGSCTNSSYEDITRAASVAREAVKKGLKAKVPLYITPGSEQVRLTIERDGLLKDFEAIGGTVLANACGPCIGQWQRKDIQEGESNSIVSSFNRNFPKRNDGNAQTLSFITSPEVVVGYALSGRLDLDFINDGIDSVQLSPPVGKTLPAKGFALSSKGYVAPPENGEDIEVIIKKDSIRIEDFEGFSAWDGKDFTDCEVLLKAIGKCTTDHISPAGPWLRYRGHLSNISKNLLIGANNEFTFKPGTTFNNITREEQTPYETSQCYKNENINWIVIGDENFGEGSSREHAAMEIRFMGGVAVIARSFARIHEANLKKQGVLALTFVDSEDYLKIEKGNTVSIVDLKDLAPGKNIKVRIEKGIQCETIEVKHTYSSEQIEWFKKGSALNCF